QLSTGLQKAKQIGVDDQLLVEFAGVPSKAQIELDNATNVRAYRAVNDELKSRLSKLSLMIADQETTNKLVDQYAAQAAAQNQGDAGKARAGATAALAKVQGDLQTARIFSMDVSIVDLNVQKLAVRLNSATTAAGLEQVAGGLMVQEKVLTDAMAQTLPEKALALRTRHQRPPLRPHRGGHRHARLRQRSLQQHGLALELDADRHPRHRLLGSARASLRHRT